MADERKLDYRKLTLKRQVFIKLLAQSDCYESYSNPRYSVFSKLIELGWVKVAETHNAGETFTLTDTGRAAYDAAQPDTRTPSRFHPDAAQPAAAPEGAEAAGDAVIEINGRGMTADQAEQAIANFALRSGAGAIISALEAENAALSARVEALEAALKPLAQFKGVYPGLSWAEMMFAYKDKSILFGDVIRADRLIYAASTGAGSEKEGE